MPFRVKMEFNLAGRDLDEVQKAVGRNVVTAEEIQAFLEREYVEEVANGAERHMEITVTELPQ